MNQSDKGGPVVETVRLHGAGLVIAADHAGPRDGPIVLLSHGGGQTRHSWGTALEQLGAAGYSAYSLDLRGHGDSAWSPDGFYGLERFVDDLAYVAADFRRPVALVGASLGGLASLVTAGEKRADVSALVLVDVAPRIEVEGASKIGAFMAANPDGFASLEEAADVVSAYMPHRPRPKDVSGLMKNLRLGEDGRLRWHWDPRFVGREVSSGEILGNQARLEAAARSLDMPALLVRGAMSTVVSPEGVAEFQRLAPHAEVVDVAGADHMVAGDQNDPFNTAVIGFLDRVRANLSEG